MAQTIERVLLNCLLDSLEARLLMQHVLKVDHTWLAIHRQERLKQEQIHDFNMLVNRRIFGEPIAYILGQREFYGFNFKISSATLIPRPETELLVDTALIEIPEDKPYRILDLGTGSGAIAIAVALNRKKSEVIAVDYSLSALKLAQENAKILNANNVTFLQSDWFSNLKTQLFDIILANPPYIENEDPHINLGDLRFEPKEALCGGKDGLDAIRKIVTNSQNHLVPGGQLLFEHGYNQSQACQALLHETGFINISSISDLTGILRVTRGVYI